MWQDWESILSGFECDSTDWMRVAGGGGAGGNWDRRMGKTEI